LAGAIQTPDGAWRVEVYRKPRTSDWWYRLVNDERDNTIADLTIGTVERLLEEMGYHLADLVDGPPVDAESARQTDETA
jgi:hypothetical protein